VVSALRDAGYNATVIVETAPGATDLVVINIAVQERRTLITEDTDFGELV